MYVCLKLTKYKICLFFFKSNRNSLHPGVCISYYIYFVQCIANWAIEAVGGACTMDNVAPFSCLLLVSSSKASCICLEMGGREVTMLLLFFFFFFFLPNFVVRLWSFVHSSVLSALLCLVSLFLGLHIMRKIGYNFVEYCCKVSNMLTEFKTVFEQKYIDFLFVKFVSKYWDRRI